ncbi:MAG: 2OG-Fe dioxygenase family protein [Bacteroidota bacterium]
MTTPTFQEAKLRNLAPNLHLPKIKNQFTGLTRDPYLKEGFRYKEIARYRVNGNMVVRQPHGPLFQATDHNPTHGGITRHYPAFDPQGNIRPEINHIVRTFARNCQLTYQDEILFQAQRITCTAGMTGLPAVEGWHQDGTNFIGMMCVDRHNVSGGASQLSFDKGVRVVFDHILQPGELLMLDDRTYWHYATPIQPVDPMAKSYRDIFIICAPSCREPMAEKIRLRA